MGEVVVAGESAAVVPVGGCNGWVAGKTDVEVTGYASSVCADVKNVEFIEYPAAVQEWKLE